MRVVIQSSRRRKFDSPGPRIVPDRKRADLGVSHDHHEELIRRMFSGEESKQVVAFISSLRGEGVTHVCRSVAAELAASQGCSVVVVDGWALAEHEESEDLGGLEAHTLVGSSEVWVWPSRDSAGERFAPPDRIPYEFNLTLEQLRREYDFVLLDCPPVEFGRAGLALAAKAQKTILVVEECRVSRRTVASAQRSLEIRGARLAGCILNWGREL